MTVMAASDEAELVHMVATQHAHDSGPIALRYPRGRGGRCRPARARRAAADRQGAGSCGVPRAHGWRC
ncbi:hypothetical protein [Methylobacterium sp.]|uniref:hypothetical protein n=1 Tax=Methylobacterium sp. TaxID=409 RepID=UPI003B5BBE9B